MSQIYEKLEEKSEDDLYLIRNVVKLLGKLMKDHEGDSAISDEAKITSPFDMEEIYLCLKKLETAEEYINMFCSDMNTDESVSLRNRKKLLRYCEEIVYEHWGFLKRELIKGAVELY